MKTVWIDIFHPAQLNFYFNIIKLLSREYNLIITVLDRGKLPLIAKKELGKINNAKLIVIGRHRGSRLSAVIEANFLRLVLLFFVLIRNRINLHYSNGFHGSLLSKIFCYPSITFGDDPNTGDYRFKLLFSNKAYYCLYNNRFVNISKKAIIFKCLKEWAYLNSRYFKPDEVALKEYGLKPYEYIFIREVSTGTINYTGQKSGLVHSVQDQIPRDYKILLSLEDKSQRHKYPSNWILLEEPLKDIHSLIYYSRALISSGDSMAREAAILGSPSIYLGIRIMPANEVLKELVDFYQVDTNGFSALLDRCLKSFSVEKKLKNIEKLTHLFMDINEFILRITIKLLRK